MASQTSVEIHGREAGRDLGSNRIWARRRPYSASFTAAAGSTNVALVTVQLLDYEGRAVAGVYNMDLWLSDDATAGAGLTATTASGTVVASTAGADLGDLTAKKMKRVQTDTTGKYILAITDTAKTGFVPCIACPTDGATIVGGALVTGSYG